MTRADVPAKAAFIRQALAGLASLPQGSLEAFLADARTLPAALHWLQTAIQALVDLGAMLVADRGLDPPRTSVDVLERLEACGALPAGSTIRFRPIIGFRNRVVHLYDRVEPAIVYRIVVEEQADLAELLALLLAAADRDPGT